MCRILMVCFSLVFVSCSVPKSEMELLDKNNIHTFCHQDTLLNTVVKLYPRLAVCYNTSTKVPVITKTDDFTLRTENILSTSIIRRENADDSIDYFHVMPAGRKLIYGFRIHLEETSKTQCPTQITMHVMNNNWNKSVDKVQKWLADSEEDCH